MRAKLETRWSNDLRERAVEPDQIEPAIAHHTEEIRKLRDDLGRHGTDTDRVRLARELARRANALRLIGELEGAADGLIEALTLYVEAGRSTPTQLTRIRLAEVWRLQGLHAEAIQALDDLEPTIHRAYRDQLHLYRGLAIADLGGEGAAEVAERELLNALAVRRERGKGEAEIEGLLSLLVAGGNSA